MPHAGDERYKTDRQIPRLNLAPYANKLSLVADRSQCANGLFCALPHAQVPYVVLNLRAAATAPLRTAAHATLGAARSTSFLSAFVGLYQATVSAHHRLFAGDSKFLYYFAGAAVWLEGRPRFFCCRS
jgi:hypothetical protein